jgi:RNA polymerase sigma-B factor
VDVPNPSAAGIRSVGPDALARAYARTRDRQTRDDLVRACAGVVRAIAGEFAPRADADLIQVGYIGLLNAAEHFDAGRGTPFLAFARHYIRGEIRHHLRDRGALVRRPRWFDRLNGEIERALGEHLHERGRLPGLSDLAARLGLGAEVLAGILRARQLVRPLSLDAVDDEGQTRVDLRRSAAGVAPAPPPVEDRVVLLEAMRSLNPLQRAVVFYLFFTDLTQTDAAARMGISQKHVSRVLASALHRLRAALGPDLQAR